MSINVGHFQLDHWLLYEANDSEGVQLEVFLSRTLTYDIGHPIFVLAHITVHIYKSCTSLSQIKSNIESVLDISLAQ